MAMLQFCVKREDTDARLGVSLAIVLTAVAHKYSIASLVPAVSYLTCASAGLDRLRSSFPCLDGLYALLPLLLLTRTLRLEPCSADLDKYVFFSTLLITLITLQGGLIGSIEGFYCRTQAVYTEPEDDKILRRIRRLSAVVRSLAVSGGGSVSAGTRARAVVGSGKTPLYYLDEDCPFSAHSDFNKFDWLDAACVGFDFLLWIVLQLWALRYYFKVIHGFSRRSDDIIQRKRAHTRAASVVAERSEHSRRKVFGTPLPALPSTMQSKDGALMKSGSSIRMKVVKSKTRQSSSNPLTENDGENSLRDWSHMPRRREDHDPEEGEAHAHDEESMGAQSGEERGADAGEGARPPLTRPGGVWGESGRSRAAPNLLWPTPQRVSPARPTRIALPPVGSEALTNKEALRSSAAREGVGSDSSQNAAE